MSVHAAKALGRWLAVHAPSKAESVTVGEIAEFDDCPVPLPEDDPARYQRPRELRAQRIGQGLKRAESWGLAVKWRPVSGGPWRWYAPEQRREG